MANKSQHSKGKSTDKSHRKKDTLDAKVVSPHTEDTAVPATVVKTTPTPRAAVASRNAFASAFATSYPYIKGELVKIAVVTVVIVAILIVVALLWR
jgi:hypothetical protein